MHQPIESASDEYFNKIVNFRVVFTGFYTSLSRACIPNPHHKIYTVALEWVSPTSIGHYIYSSSSLAYVSMAASYREA